MHLELLTTLRCPQTGTMLHLEDAKEEDGQIHSGWLVSEEGGHRYPVREFVPRFVPGSNYADSFGRQWNQFRQTQLDSYSGHPISARRFWQSTDWTPEELQGQWVLDVGCGAGRFAEVVLQAGAKVIALDYSNAVDACFQNLRRYPDFHVVQGDIYQLPLRRGTFPFVYCLGVLQHTPDVAKAFAGLPALLVDGGRLCVDVYEKSWKAHLLPKYWLRPFTRRMPKDRLFVMLQHWVPRMLPVSRLLARIPVAGPFLRRVAPVADYTGILPLSETQHVEWSLLDTFDMFSPEFDHPQSARTLARWLAEAGLSQIEVRKINHLVGRGCNTRAAGN